MANISDGIQYVLEQKIVPSIFEASWKLDPIFPMIARSSFNVRRNNFLGRGWQVLKTWSEGVAGGAKFTSVGGGNVVSGTDNFQMYSSTQTFPSFDETTAPAFFQSTVTLIEHRGNFFLPHTILRADRLNSSIGSVVAKNLQGVSTLLAQQEAALFYTSAPKTGALADIGNTSDVAANSSGDTAAIDFDLSATDASGRIHRFRQGMLVDLYNTAGTVKRNQGFFLAVDNVDPLTQKVQLRRVDGGTFQVDTVLGGGISYDGGGGDDDIIVIKDSIQVDYSDNIIPRTLESWILNTGTFYNIDVTKHGNFKSYIPSSISAALTEAHLNKHVGFFFESFPGKELSAALTTMGVLIGFIDNLEAWNQGSAVLGSADDGVVGPRMRYDRNAQALNIQAGWDSFKYRFAGRPLEIYTSTYCAKGTFYAGKFMNGGITRYVPPAIPGSKVDSRFGTEVEFIAPLGGTGGYQGIFKHHHSNSGATTDFIEAPFVRQWNLMPDQPNHMKLTGITEVLG